MTQAKTFTVDVVAVEQVTPLISVYTLRKPDGGDLPPFSGGSHIIVVMPGQQRTYRNPYSLLSSPRDRGKYQIAVRRDDHGRGGSLFMHQHIRAGCQLEIGNPVNLFSLVKQARLQILIAGGVGITPVMAMIDDLESARTPWELHYAFRGSEHDHFGSMLQSAHRGRVSLYDTSNGTDLDFAKILSHRPLGTHVYTCGPARMIDSVEQAALLAGWPRSHIHYERFAAPTAGEPFDAFLVRSQIPVHVLSGQTLLEAMEAAGIDAPYMCRGGACGQCETEVLALNGELIHHDHWLSDEDRATCKKIMPCVSRARGTRLELDR